MTFKKLEEKAKNCCANQAERYAKDLCFCGTATNSPFLKIAPKTTTGFFLFCNNCKNEKTNKFAFKRCGRKLTKKEHFTIKILFGCKDFS